MSNLVTLTNVIEIVTRWRAAELQYPGGDGKVTCASEVLAVCQPEAVAAACPCCEHPLKVHGSLGCMVQAHHEDGYSGYCRCNYAGRIMYDAELATELSINAPIRGVKVQETPLG